MACRYSGYTRLSYNSAPEPDRQSITSMALVDLLLSTTSRGSWITYGQIDEQFHKMHLWHWILQNTKIQIEEALLESTKTRGRQLHAVGSYIEANALDYPDFWQEKTQFLSKSEEKYQAEFDKRKTEMTGNCPTPKAIEVLHADHGINLPPRFLMVFTMLLMVSVRSPYLGTTS